MLTLLKLWPMDTRGQDNGADFTKEAAMAKLAASEAATFCAHQAIQVTPTLEPQTQASLEPYPNRAQTVPKSSLGSDLPLPNLFLISALCPDAKRAWPFVVKKEYPCFCPTSSLPRPTCSLMRRLKAQLETFSTVGGHGRWWTRGRG